MKALIKNRLSLALLLASLPGLASAAVSQNTPPVVGQGAPAAPANVTLGKALKVGQVSTATASGYSDPDADPFAGWEYQWWSGANGTGSQLGMGESFTPGNTNAVYLRVRALATRGYPEEQKSGEWLEQSLTPVVAGIGAACLGGSTLTSGGLTWTCPLTEAEAVADGVSYKPPLSETGQLWVRMDWSMASSYCSNLGYRLPTDAELTELYGAMGSLTLAGWPTSSSYWSSTFYSAGSPYVVNLASGTLAYISQYVYNFVTCVR